MLRVGARYRSTGTQPPDPEPQDAKSELQALNIASRFLSDPKIETVVITRAETEDSPRDDPSTLRNEAPGPSTDLIG